MFTIVAVILALIFLIPTSGLSLLCLAIFLFIKFSTKHAKVQNAIVTVANHPKGNSILGFAVDVPYTEFVGYAEGNTIIKIQGEMVTFRAIIKEYEYEVTLNREPLGKRAIISAQKLI